MAKPITTHCDNCGKEITIPYAWYKRTKTHTCSRKCSAELKSKSKIKVCEYCGKEFYGKSHQSERKYCSIECQRLASKKRVKLICQECGKEYEVVESRANTSKYCSKECKHKAIEKTLTKRVGPLNSRWKGYKDRYRSDKSKLKSWATEVKRRDGRCMVCGSTKDLQAHHIIPYSVNRDKAFDVNNGITLCRKCHAEAHKDDKIKVIQLINYKYYGEEEKQEVHSKSCG